MEETKDEGYEEELLDYEEEEDKAPDSVGTKVNGEAAKKGYVGIHSSGFRDFLLKPELLRAIVDSGFEHPSEVQHECIPQAILGMDVLCQAKSGMGKTAVFVLSTLQQIDPIAGQVSALVLCHTRELAYQICHEFERFSTYLPDLKVAVFYGGVNIKVHKDLLKNECPHIVVGTPGRILALTRDKDLSLKNVRHFILDECDKMLESLDMRKDVQDIFKMTPHDKQVMMFSATLSKEIRPVCKKFMQDPMEIYVDDEAKLTLHFWVSFFDSLDSSIRLSKLKGSMPTFTNISPKIECLTDRRFTHGHLAQLKFILPEAIAVKKMLVFDERTSCMKPDLHVSINPDAVESDAKLKPECGTLSMRKLFRARLRDFCKSHPEGDEIPEEILPEPFNHRKQDCLSEIFETHSSAHATVTSSDACAAHPPTLSSVYMQDSDIADNTEPVNLENNLPAAVKTSIEALNLKPAVASHMSQSFRRRFSQKSIENGSDNVKPKLPSDPSQPLSFSGSESNLKKNAPFLGTRSHPKSCTSKLVSEAASSEICPTISASSDCFMPSGAPPATPSKTNEYTENDGSLKSIDAMSTPAKLVSTPSRLMTATPALPPPKRQSSSSLNKLVRRPPRSRSLKFDTPVKNKETENEDYAGGLSIDDDIFDILPENLLQSIREKEIIAMEERDPAISQAKRRQKMVAKLPKLFNMINLLFHSINRSVITKEELVSKIISSHCDIVDRREVEEQLKLLLELVPEWISEKLASSGDFLMCVNKMVNPEAIRTSLEEAK